MFFGLFTAHQASIPAVMAPTPPDNPSKPSKKLTVFIIPTIQKSVNTTPTTVGTLMLGWLIAWANVTICERGLLTLLRKPNPATMATAAATT